MIDKDDIPNYDWFKRRRVRLGNCLAHGRRLFDLVGDHPDTPYVLCMGSCFFGLHCWLEARSVVVDLTTREKFFEREDYYDEEEVDPGSVRRYPHSEICDRLIEVGYWGFWDFSEAEIREGTTPTKGRRAAELRAKRDAGLRGIVCST